MSLKKSQIELDCVSRCDISVSQNMKNGYYENNSRYYPRVSSILSVVGGKDGLIKWAVMEGAKSLIAELIKAPDLVRHTITDEVRIVYGKEKSVIKASGIYNMAKEIAVAGYEGEKTRTAEYGTSFHNLAERIAIGKDIDESLILHPNLKRSFVALKDFTSTAKMKTVFAEQTVYSHNPVYAGTVDLIAEIEINNIKPYLSRTKSVLRDGVYVIDYKTGSFHRQKHGLQLGAYWCAIQETLDISCHGGLVIHAPREEPEKITVKYFSGEEIKDYSRKFNLCHQVWSELEAPLWWHADMEKANATVTTDKS